MFIPSLALTIVALTIVALTILTIETLTILITIQRPPRHTQVHLPFNEAVRHSVY